MKKHLTLEGRSFIAANLKLGRSLGEIAAELGVSTSTVSREIKKHRVLRHSPGYGRRVNTCANAMTCSLKGVCENNPDCVSRRCSCCGKCNAVCPQYVKEECPKLSKPPYVCNGCDKFGHCRLDNLVYDPSVADKEYRTLLKDCRSGFNMTEEELASVDSVVSPLIKKGQSVYSVLLNNKPMLRCSKNTIYRLIHSAALVARAIDLPRAVRFKPRKSASAGAKVDRNCREGRSYADYLRFRENNPDVSFVQMDSVEGVRGGAVLLTLELESCNFMLAFYREHNNAQSVNDIFDRLYELLPEKVYHSMLGHLLTDNGSEFSNPNAIEYAADGTRRSRLFYCNAYAAYQKPKVENNHGLVRNIFPKGKPLDGLTEQQVNLAMSHVNSYRRDKFNGISPTELFVAMYGEEVLHLLGQTFIQPNDVILRPWLLGR